MPSPNESSASTTTTSTADDDDNESSSSSSEPSVEIERNAAANRSRRANAGLKMHQLIEEEELLGARADDDDDDAYQNIFAEVEADDDFKQAEDDDDDAASVSGESGISRDESDDDDEEADDDDDDYAPDRKGVAKKQKSRVALKRSAAATTSGDVVRPRRPSKTLKPIAETVSEEASVEMEQSQSPLGAEELEALALGRHRSIRTSTFRRTLETQERKQLREEERLQRPQKKKKTHKRLTTEQLQRLAAEREVVNRRWLDERSKTVLDEQKSRRRKKATRANVPMIRFESRLTSAHVAKDAVAAESKLAPHKPIYAREERCATSDDDAEPEKEKEPPTADNDTVEIVVGIRNKVVFPNKTTLRHFFPRPIMPKSKRCPMTGRPRALYRDPVTNIPYSDKAALVKIRRDLAEHIARRIELGEVSADDSDVVQYLAWHEDWMKEHGVAG